MFGKLTSAASKVAGTAANTVSGTASFAEDEAAKVGGAVANTASAVGHGAYEVGATGANTVSSAVSFSEQEAMKHVRALTGLSSPGAAQEFVNREFQIIKDAAVEEVDFDVDIIFPDQKSAALKLSPKNAPEANKNAILVSSGLNPIKVEDDSSNVAVMLELARSISQSATGFKNSVIFFFNTAEEEGLDGSHSFITQNPWNATIRLAVDLEGMGIGGQPIISQAPVSKQAGGLKNPVVVLFDGEEGLNDALNQNISKQAVLDFERIHKGKSFQVQDIFVPTTIDSQMESEIYKEVGGLSGLDYEEAEGGVVYHTKEDKMEHLKPGSIQHLGENMLPFLIQVAAED